MLLHAADDLQQFVNLAGWIGTFDPLRLGMLSYPSRNGTEVVHPRSILSHALFLMLIQRAQTKQHSSAVVRIADNENCCDWKDTLVVQSSKN